MAQLLEISQVGKREDLADLIAVVDAKSTPVISMIRKGKKPANTLTQWQADSVPAAKITGTVDGVDVDTSSDLENMAAGRKLLKVYVQKYRRVPAVSDLAEEVNVAGIGAKGELAAAVAKGLKLIKRDIEASFCTDVDTQADAGTATAYLTRGLGQWIQNGAQGVLPVDSSFRTPAASINATAIASLTEKEVQDVLESIYLQTGEAGKTFVLVCGSKLKRRFTEFTEFQSGVSSEVGVLRTYNKGDGRKIVQTVDFFQGDFGALELHPSTWLAADQAEAVQLRRGYVLNMDLLEIRYMRLPQVRQLEDRGGGPRALIDAIAALVVHNPLGLGKFAATS